MNVNLGAAERFVNGIGHAGEFVNERSYCFTCNEFAPCRVRLAARSLVEGAYAQALNDVAEQIRALPVECGYDPMPLLGQPIGMFHCPDCGDMVLAGMPHPPSEIVITILETLESSNG